jgi:spore germination protein YaaH
MRTLWRGLPIVMLLARVLPAQQLEALWYSVGSEQSTQSFLAHADHISIISPQVFGFDKDGAIHGHVDPRVIAKAREQKVKLMPLVMNPGFDQPLIHRILTVPDVRKRAVASLVSLCRDNHFDGLQFDIENINVADKTAFTDFVRESAGALHAINCTISAAVVPRISDDPGPTNYHRWMYENWRGAYDFKALAESLDFISYMTYAQHTGGSTPGPVAGFTWMEDALKFALSTGVPPEKISLGIPSYSDWWYPTYTKKSGAQVRGNDISFARVSELVTKYSLTPTWDDREKAAFAIWSNAGVNELMWIENAQAFAAKIELVRKYKLRGYSVWVLGMEDPKVWALDTKR